MSNYHSDDMAHYGFKIVRASTRRFQRTEVFQQLVQEETQAGWELLEKLDDQRVRLKRSKDARRKDATLPAGVDPYRTQFGDTFERRSLIVGFGVMMTLVLGGIFAFMSAEIGSFEIPERISMIMAIMGILVTVIAGAGVVARNR